MFNFVASAGRFIFGAAKDTSDELLGATRADKAIIDDQVSEDGSAYDTDVDATPHYEESCSDTHETTFKDVFQFGNTEVTNAPPIGDFSLGKSLDVGSLCTEDETTSLLSRPNDTNAFSASSFGFAKKHEDQCSTRPKTKAKSPQKKQKVNRAHQRQYNKRKRQADESSLSSDDKEHFPLLNIQKDGRESTSDYVSQASEEPPETPQWSPFQRNNGTRISNMTRWNSVAWISDEKEKQRPRRQKNPNFTHTQLNVKSIKNSIIHTGSDKNESTVLSTFQSTYLSNEQVNLHMTRTTHIQNLALNSTEWDVISKRVKDQTRKKLEAFKSNGPIVETEGFLGAKQLVTEAKRRKKPIIVIGSGDGVTTLVNAVQVHLCSIMNVRNENDIPLVEESSDSDTDDSAVLPYVLYDPSDWNAVDLNKPTVIAIHDPSGTIQTDMNLLDAMLRRVDQCLSDRRDVTVLIAMKRFPDFDDAVIMEKYGDFIVDLQSPEYLISETSMKYLLENFMKKHNVKYTSAQNKMKLDSEKEQSLSHDVAADILRDADRRGFVKELTKLFEGDLTNGSLIFTEPDDGIVKQVRLLCEEKDPGFYALLAVYDYRGEISRQRIEEIRRYLMRDKPAWSAWVLDKLSSNDVRGYNYRPAIPQQSLAVKFARKNKCEYKLGDLLQDGIERQDQNLLEERHQSGIYRFRSGKVRTSLLIVLAGLFPGETLLSCDDDFISQYVLPRSAGRRRQSDLYVVVESNANCGVKKAVMKRITDDLLQRKISMYTKHPLFAEAWFVDELFNYWTRKDLLWKVLQIQESSLDPYCLLKFGVDQMFTIPASDGAHNVAEKVLKQKKWTEKRRNKSKRSEWVNGQEHAAMLQAVELGRPTTVRMLADTGMAVTTNMLRIAIVSGQTEVVKVFKEIDKFTDSEWWDSMLYSFEVFCKDDSKQSSKDIFEQLIEKASFHCTGDTVQPLIQHAVAENNMQMVELLCSLSKNRDQVRSQRVNINIISSEGDTALNIATRNGNECIVKKLLEAGAKQINQGNVAKLPVHEAAEKGNVQLLKIFINNSPFVLNIKDPEGKTPLHIATEHGHAMAVKELLQMEGIEINLQDSNKQTPLHVATKLGHVHLVEILLERNADLTKHDIHNETALGLAGLHSQYTCAEAILTRLSHVDPDFQQEGETLRRAILDSDYRLLSLLIRHGCSINMEVSRAGPPLMIAILNNMHDMVRFLLENGADVNQATNGRQPILLAALKGEIDMFLLLRSHGADVSVIDEHTKNSVVHNVAKADNEGLTVQILSLPESPALVDMKNVEGETAVHITCREGHNANILGHLLDATFSKWIRNKHKDDPMMIVEARQKNAAKERNFEEWKHCSKLVHALKIK